MARLTTALPGICLMLLLSGVNAAVQLTLLGRPATNAVVKLCPNDDYVLVFQCEVTGVFSFLWLLPPFIDPSLRYDTSNTLGQIDRSPATVLLTKKVTEGNIDTYLYESELRVPTKEIRNAITEQQGSLLVVTCEATDGVQKMSMFYGVEEPPQIRIEVLSRNALSVNMSITIEDILIIIVVAINTKSGIERSYVVGKEKREATLDNLEPAYYNMTVFVFDTCGQNFSSETVHQLLPSDTTELFSFPEILSTSSPLESSPPASTPELIFLTSEKLLPFGTPETTLLHCIEENSPGNEARLTGGLAAVTVVLGIFVICIVIFICLICLVVYYKKVKAQGFFRPSDGVELETKAT